MDKWELIEITLDQLIKQWEDNRDSFDIDIGRGESFSSRISLGSTLSIFWSPYGSSNNPTDSMKLQKGVMITYDRKNEFRCLIYRVDRVSQQPIEGSVAENSISARRCFVPIRQLYRKFANLRSKILKHKMQKTNSLYMSSLCGVFPGTLDEHLIGGTDDEEE